LNYEIDLRVIKTFTYLIILPTLGGVKDAVILSILTPEIMGLATSNSFLSAE